MFQVDPSLHKRKSFKNKQKKKGLRAQTTSRGPSKLAEAFWYQQQQKYKQQQQQQEELNSSFMSLDDDEEVEMNKENDASMVNKDIAQSPAVTAPGSVKKSGASSSRSKAKSSKKKTVKKRDPGSARVSSQRKVKRAKYVDDTEMGSAKKTPSTGTKRTGTKKKKSTIRRKAPGSGAVDLDSSLLDEEDQLRFMRENEEDLEQRAKHFKSEGNTYYSDGDYVKAIEAYSKAIENDPMNPIYYGNRAAAELMLGQHQNAARDCEQALKVDPSYERVRCRAARAYLAIGDIKGAHMHLQQAINNTDFAKEAQAILDQCKAYEQYIEKADQLLLKEELEQCDKVTGMALQLAPESPRLYMIRQTGKLLYAAIQGNKVNDAVYQKQIMQKVKVSLEEAVAKVDSNAEMEALHGLLYHYGKILLYCSLMVESRILFRIAAKIKPNDQRTNSRLHLIEEMESCLQNGVNAFARKNCEEAIRYFDQALKLDANNHAYNGRVCFRRAAADMALGHAREAIRDCTNCLRYIPTYHKARIRRAHAYIFLGDYRAGVAELEETYRLQPTDNILKELKAAKEALDKQRKKQYKQWQDQRSSSSTAGSNNWSYRSNSSSSSNNNKNNNSNSNNRSSNIRKSPRATSNDTSSSRSSKPRKSIEIIKTGDHYEVLGITKKATSGSIKKAYKKKALKYHPDKSKSPNAEFKFKRIAEAYRVLSSPTSKRTYDQCNLSKRFFF